MKTLFFITLLTASLNSFSQQTDLVYTYNGNLVVDLPVIAGEKSSMIFTEKGECIIIVPTWDKDWDSCLYISWGYLKNQNDTFEFVAYESEKADTGLFNTEKSKTVDGPKAMEFIYKDKVAKFQSWTRISQVPGTFRFVIRGREIVPV